LDLLELLKISLTQLACVRAEGVLNTSHLLLLEFRFANEGAEVSAATSMSKCRRYSLALRR
jgi:hypothetical protein